MKCYHITYTFRWSWHDHDTVSEDWYEARTGAEARGRAIRDLQAAGLHHPGRPLRITCRRVIGRGWHSLHPAPGSNP
jgi:hypothetical protein